MGKWEPATQSQSADQPGVCVRAWCLTSATVSCPHEYIIVGPKLPSSAHRTPPFAIYGRPPNLARAHFTSSPNSQHTRQCRPPGQHGLAAARKQGSS